MTPTPPPLPADIAPSERDQQTRERLLAAGVHVFDRKGYTAASVREITELAGVTKPALYYHFGSKEGLLVTILEQATRSFMEATAQAVLRTGPTIDRVTAFCDDIFALFEQTVPIVRVAHTVLFGPPDAAPPFDPSASERQVRQLLQQMIEDGQAAGDVRRDLSAEDVSLAVMGLLEGCWARQLHSGFDRIDLATLRRIVRILFEGVSAPRTTAGENT